MSTLYTLILAVFWLADEDDLAEANAGVLADWPTKGRT